MYKVSVGNPTSDTKLTKTFASFPEAVDYFLETESKFNASGTLAGDDTKDSAKILAEIMTADTEPVPKREWESLSAEQLEGLKKTGNSTPGEWITGDEYLYDSV